MTDIGKIIALTRLFGSKAVSAIASSGSVEKTAHGTFVSFTDGASASVKNLLVSVEAVQSGSGNPAPDNIRSISGWTGLKLYKTGKNLAKFNDASNVSSALRRTVTITNGLIKTKASGAVSSSVIVNGAAFRGTIAYRDFPSGTYTFSIADFDTNIDGLTASGIKLNLSDDTKVSNGSSWVLDSASKLPSGLYYESNIDWANNKYIAFRVQIEAGSDATPFESFGTVVPISWQTEAGTVYGGTLDVTSGVLTVTYGYIPDLGALTWTLSGSVSNLFSTPLSAFPLPAKQPTSGNKANAMTDRYAVGITPASVSTDPPDDKTFIIGCSGINDLYVRDSTYSDKSTFETAMKDVPLVYELVTPQTYQLTPADVQTLLGTNNIWADTGETTITYLSGSGSSANIKYAIMALAGDEDE